MNNKIAIQLTNISKSYEIHHDKPTLVEKIVKRKKEQFIALDNISLTVKAGEFVGIIGPNGSGKTTLLKIIVGITTPTQGVVQVHGKVVSLIDLEAGFHPDLTGIQNIYLNGILLGMSKAQITKDIHSIIDFADIHQFIDVPLFTYSSGMKLRLGFAIAVHSDPDILVLDESIGVGDLTFQTKSLKKISQLFSKGKTIIIASHWLNFIKKSCKRVLIMEKGEIRIDGKPNNVRYYQQQS